mmetsp:Transcript_20216/g.29693  ORF Transcript_20216/g.29693 Transcript_20216/m.29693 type:complete len:204 (-) Transcript_20216:411-1022(-)
MAKFGRMHKPLIRNPVEGVVNFFNPNFLEGFFAFDHSSGSKRPSSRDWRTMDEIPSAPTHRSATRYSPLSPLRSIAIFTRPSSVGSTCVQRTPRSSSTFAHAPSFFLFAASIESAISSTSSCRGIQYIFPTRLRSSSERFCRTIFSSSNASVGSAGTTRFANSVTSRPRFVRSISNASVNLCPRLVRLPKRRRDRRSWCFPLS